MFANNRENEYMLEITEENYVDANALAIDGWNAQG